MQLPVHDVLEPLAVPTSYDDILADHDELEHHDTLTVLGHAAYDSATRA